MEDLKTVEDFAEVFCNGSDYGYGSGDGDGDGDGSGGGSGGGSGSGRGFGDCSGDCSGDSSGSGYGNGYGLGSGSGFSCGFGYGYGSGDGSLLDLVSFCGHKVYNIDDIPTLVYYVRGRYAGGAIINDDLTLSPCIIAKGENSIGETVFAHGEDIHKAFNSLQEKLYETYPVRIE